MDKFIKISTIAFVVFGLGFSANAQMGMMMNQDISGVDWAEIVEHTLAEEQEGKEVWEKIQAGQLNCDSLSEDDFGVLGEYFMGRMMGDSHAFMNAMMMQAHGEEGEEQMHVAMGQRLSGCNASASYGEGGYGWMPMMQMWGGGVPGGMMGYNNPMNFGFGFHQGFGLFGLIFMVIWWVLLIVALVFFIRWLLKYLKGGSGSALGVLQERYAKGEINKQEFEEKKKDLMS